MPLLLLRPELYPKPRPLTPVQGDGALKLLCQAGDQLHAQGRGIPEINPF